MAITSCTRDRMIAAAKCFDCLSATEKLNAKVWFMAEAYRIATGTDLRNVNTRNKVVECLACLPDFRMDSIEVAIWQTLAEGLGSTPLTIAQIKDRIKCSSCGEQKTNRAAMLYFLCAFARLGLSH